MNMTSTIRAITNQISSKFGKRISYISATLIDSSSENTDQYINNEILSKYLDEIKSLRGTPELVDRLENLVARYPGIELNMELYRSLYSFPLDSFQEEGLSALMKGNNVVVSTPTGSGKTLVGELAIYFAIMMGLRVAYTTPLKALSNQKFQDFKARYGGDRVGLLTGDIAINRGAPITIMTTEVFRNMIYDQDSQNQLSNLFMVCFDEFHFMNDPDRGTVWEESVISCPPSVRILALSATMGNVNDIKGWISSIHGPTELILSEHRPVPLRYLFSMRQGLFPLFRDPNAGPGALAGVKKTDGKLDNGVSINPTIIKYEEQFMKNAQSMKMTRSGRPLKGMKPNPQSMIASYSSIAEDLFSLNKLPAIVFIFSRAGCEQAAKQVTQMKTQMLTKEDISYVNQALNNFVINNPEIPVAKASVQMLRAGVGVHHAGLITVWKAFIEDLFNANKIKILFATETLAAGVNMPARTTIVTTVTKRINSEIIKLKTSQLLQMAGRAGRRGKDTEGTVVIMRNRFEDVKMSHKILTTPTDGIKSHFKTSYGLCVKLLQTKSLDECRALIERGFGAYLLQQKISKKIEAEDSVLANHRSILQKYTLQGARDYLKLLRRLEKEKKNYDYLVSKMLNSENELVQAIADYMPVGIGIQLRNGECGFFLGDVKWNQQKSITNGLGLISSNGEISIVRKEHIRSFADTDDCLPSKASQSLLDLVSLCTSWEDIIVDDCTTPILRGSYPINEVYADPKMQTALELIKNSNPCPSPPQVPGSIIKQKLILDDIEKEYLRHKITKIPGEEDRLIDALRYAASMKDPIAFVGKTSKNELGSKTNGTMEVFAWKMFKNVYSILQKFEALDGVNSTELGEMVSSLSSDNELWLAMVLKHPAIAELSVPEFGALINSVLTDGYKSSNAFFKFKASERMQEVYSLLEPLQQQLRIEQSEGDVDFPIHLCIDAAGLIESWANGTSWRELCKETSLDQGDICRMLRRSVEILRQIPNAYGVPPNIAQLAYEAASKMDRFPVADLDTGEIVAGTTDTAGRGFEFGERKNNDNNQVDINDDGSFLDKFLDESSSDILEAGFSNYSDIEDDSLFGLSKDDKSDIDLEEILGFEE